MDVISLLNEWCHSTSMSDAELHMKVQLMVLGDLDRVQAQFEALNNLHMLTVWLRGLRPLMESE